jgi:hypothetical protein
MSKSILVLSLALLPLMNLVFYYLIWKCLFIYNRRKRVFLRNLALLTNPFERMVFSPEVCEIMGRNHWFFTVK